MPLSAARSMFVVVAFAAVTMVWPQVIDQAAAADNAVGKQRYAPVVADDGLLTQPWFTESFLDLKDDLAEATSQGRRLAIFWEQRGCPYCKEMHTVNLAEPDIADYIRAHFTVLQLNIYGSKSVTDFDGEVLEERALARKYGVVFTPTIQYFPYDPAAVVGKKGNAAEVARMPGYFKPFHFVSMFEYVFEKAYEKQGFQAFLQAKAERLRAEGKDVKLW